MPVRRTLIGLSMASALLCSFAGSAFAEDVSCLQRAVDQRQKDLRDAYSQYANSMGDAVGRLTTDEHHALDQNDANYRSSDTSNAFGIFNYAVNNNWQQLSTRLFQVWSDYYRERYQCGFSQTPPPSYGGSQNYNYYYGNTYNAPVYCSQPILTAPPAGCAYECASDSNGCQRCHLACRTPVSYQACNCPAISSPVCSRDNRTYDNACLAICDGRAVWHIGVCY